MGTSGAYGGSGSQGWGAARSAFDEMPDPGAGAGEAPGGTGGEPSDAAADAAAAIADALWREDPAVRAPTPPTFGLGELVPRRSSSRGGGGGGGGSRGASTGAGRSGAGSSRRVARAAQRGGHVLAAGQALRDRDRDALSEYGLDLDELEALTPIEQQMRILDTVLGEATHPDERALRRASLEQLKELFDPNTDSTPLDLIRGFVGRFVFEQGIVEIRSQMDAGRIDVTVAGRKEKGIRSFIETRVRQMGEGLGRVFSRDRFAEMAGRLTTEALAVLREGAT